MIEARGGEFVFRQRCRDGENSAAVPVFSGNRSPVRRFISAVRRRRGFASQDLDFLRHSGLEIGLF
jgi:hypothetical protein